ncbi:MAG: deaminase [Pseudonocardia sp.]|nr:deaminase [Pseudonocardia sp.]
MTATYTFDVFTSLDGFGAAGGSWTGYWGKQGPELLEHRLALYADEQRMVFGATTYRAFAQMVASSTEESEVRDPWVTRMRNLPTTVVSTTLEGPLDRVQVTLFPAITGRTGLDPIFQGAADFDLELIESRTLDGHILELIYRPTLH